MPDPSSELEPFAHSSGPRDAKIVLVGEAWGEQEELVGRPFIGQSGQELGRMLAEGGIDRGKVLMTNVLNLRPPNNNLDLLCCQKKELPAGYARPFVRQGFYLRPEYLPHVDRLWAELRTFPRHLVIALGNTACWALLGSGRISSIRGTISLIGSRDDGPIKCLPTYHPAAVLRNWALRPIVVADLMKAAREGEFQEFRRPERFIVVDPSLSDIVHYVNDVPSDAILSVDIETAARQITMIGFAHSAYHALVVPFIGLHAGSYWPDLASEREAWALVQRLLHGPNPKLFQNGLYDLQYLYRMGFRPTNCIHDTMLLHHALYPEMPKNLGFLGSIYTNEAAWKLMRHADSLKRDE